MARSGAGDPHVHHITRARRPHSDDLDRRMGRYLLSMLIRTVCFLLIFVVDGPLRWVFAVGAVVLPYVAVVMANAGRMPRGSGPADGAEPVPPAALGPGSVPPRDTSAGRTRPNG